MTKRAKRGTRNQQILFEMRAEFIYCSCNFKPYAIMERNVIGTENLSNNIGIENLYGSTLAWFMWPDNQSINKNSEVFKEN